MEPGAQPAEGSDVLTVRFDEGDMLKIAALCFAISLLGSLCALWLSKRV